MWEQFEARLDQNEQEKPTPLRRAFFDTIRNLAMRPGEGVTKKMLSFESAGGDRLVWEIEHPAQNFFLHPKWRGLLEANGFVCEPKPYTQGMMDGGRHSALNRKWSFRETDCLVVRVENSDELRRLIEVVSQSSTTLFLDPIAVARWVDRLHHFFPTLHRFDEPDLDFDNVERTYKLAVASELKAAIDKADSDQECADAVIKALEKSNLLVWQTYWPITAKGDGDRERLWPALRALINAALGAPEERPEALEAFVKVWIEAVPQGKAESARQIAEFVYLHLAPENGVYIRYSVRQDLWKEAVGRPFPDHAFMADTYRDELRFMQAVRQAFEAKGLAPRDMIDVQSALWVVHNYKDEDAASFTRDAVEAAMDGYDRYLASGDNGDIFGAFGEPRDYWVRSTRERPNRVYPSKPIMGFLLNDTKLSGGWGQKQDAAAALYNAGYIIVDGNDAPLAPPQKYNHLIPDANRIRLCARNYYVELARENRAAEISIRAGDLSKAMGLQNAFPAICSALGSKEFQKAANVPAPTFTTPNPSSTTVFTYRLAALKGHENMTSESALQATTATNLIIYGPPGTGKTYATAWEAVQLCLGDASAAPLRSDRGALMAEYRRLVGEGRIEFVTFHQSFSYEDFVEGLRPTTGGEPEDAEEQSTGTSAGFSLRPFAGIFKNISEKARLDTGNTPTKRLDRSRAIYKIALGQRGTQEDRIREGLDGSLIHLGWGGDIDWSDERFDNFEAIRKEWNEKKDSLASGKDPNIEMTYAFRSGLQIDDYVVISDGRDSYRAFGRVTGEYRFDPHVSFHPHRRSVEWIWRDDNGADRAAFYPRKFRRQSAYHLDPDKIDWDALEAVVIGLNAERPVVGARPHVLIIDEINRANISKVFGELITLLEADKRLGCENEVRVRLPYSGTSFGVPSNLHIIATMNTADRSIALLDTALRRRFTFRELMPDADELRRALAAHQLEARNLDGIDLCKLLRTINERIEFLFDREHQIGHAYFTRCKSRVDVEDVMRHRIIPLLAEYFYEDWSKVAAVLGDDGNSAAPRFLEARALTAPASLSDGELTGDKLSWRVKEKFDFSEFKV